MEKVSKKGLHSPVMTNGHFPLVDGVVTAFESIHMVTAAGYFLPMLEMTGFVNLVHPMLEMTGFVNLVNPMLEMTGFVNLVNPMLEAAGFVNLFKRAAFDSERKFI